MNILITGANGQLGNEMRILSAQHPQHTFFFTDVEELDITSREAVQQFVTDNTIDVIVNCAAYTNVDKAETDEDLAHKINALAVENLGLSGAHVIHISTDYVFSGDACTPYSETDTVAPRTAYGRTKREGEKLLQAVSNKAIIFRTAWLYSTFGNNFVKTMLRLGNERELLGVVFDQIGTPTYAADLANAIFTAINAPEWHPGVYHFTNEGVCSWYDFTHEIFQLAGITKCQLRPILSSEYHYQTPRPHFSVLNKSKVKQTFGISIPHWTEALKVCLGKLLNQ
jgi:dTDP-4-dehydrorhamnose reductase